jgi:hypothetical protein
MNVYILVDENNIVRCVASEECNLHKDKLATMTKYHAPFDGIVGDEYNHKTNEWTARPENYPQPSEEEVIEDKISAERNVILRAEAIQNLKDRGEIPPDYKDVKEIGAI